VKAGEYTVTPYIRHMLLEYNRRKVGEATHQALLEKAKNAMLQVHGFSSKAAVEATVKLTFWQQLRRLLFGGDF
jgi:hypothetical protein